MPSRWLYSSLLVLVMHARCGDRSLTRRLWRPTFHPQKGAFADVVVKLGLIKLIQKRFDICDELCVHLLTQASFDLNGIIQLTSIWTCRDNTNATLKCPIEAGEHQIVQVVDLPAEIPKGMSQRRGYRSSCADLQASQPSSQSTHKHGRRRLAYQWPALASSWTS